MCGDICKCVSGDFLILQKVIVRFMTCAPAHLFLTSVRMLLNQTHSKSVGILPHPHFSIFLWICIFTSRSSGQSGDDVVQLVSK